MYFIDRWYESVFKRKSELFYEAYNYDCLKFSSSLQNEKLTRINVTCWGKKEPKNLDPYMDVLVDELIEMNGSQFFYGFRQEYFKIKIDILLHVLDYTGKNKLFHCQGMFKHKS